MSTTVGHVQSADAYRALHEALLEYERSLEPDLRHGAEPTLESVTDAYQPPNAAFLARVDGAVAGCIAGVRLDPTTVVIHHLYARPAFRNHGVGRALVDAVVAFARDGGYERVVLDTEPQRLQAAYRLYLAMGFTPCEAFASVDYRHPAYLEKRL